MYNAKSDFLICGDLNIYSLNENNWKKQLVLLLITYNLLHTVNFATGPKSKSNTAIDNIFVDSTSLKSSSTSVIINGLSDHDGQFITINNIAATTNNALEAEK
jgi:endonuclease/exonuclease/phosphatase family metal-dependent hydrolase